MISNAQREYIAKLVQEGRELPQEFKGLLFPSKQKEYELSYAGKISKQDLLANEDGVFPVPLQVEKIFNGVEHKEIVRDWKNMIVFGDNLQFLKTIYENRDPQIKDRLKKKVKLIYIDPPFATEDDFQSGRGQKAYSDKKKGAEFVEFLRRRLLLAKEILADDGSIFVHLDWKKSHYLKIVLDEVFGEKSFRNEIIWFYPRGGDADKQFNRKHDAILWYSNSSDTWTFNWHDVLIPYTQDQLDRFKEVDREGKRFYWNVNPRGERIKTYLHKPGIGEYDVWNIGINANQIREIGYPTTKPEKLLERIIKATTHENDIVMDFFGGSGTTAVVAEKLSRRWVICDIGKLAYFTIQKRILRIQETNDINNPKKMYGRRAKSFVTCSLGLYDLKRALELEWDKYQSFVAGLFEIELQKYKIGGFEFDGKKGDYPVKIFDFRSFRKSSVNEAYIREISKAIGKRAAGRIYLIAPANYVDFLSDYHEIDGLRYYFLKIPYQVIKELHKNPFQKLRQPQSRKNVNDLDETIGFHFVRQPEVKSKIIRKRDSIEIELSEFRSQYYKDEEGQILENFETLSAVFVDKKYNGKYFEMDEVFFADDLIPKLKGGKDTDNLNAIRLELKEMRNDKLKIHLKKNEVGKKVMLIYTDIYGNDFTEIYEL